MHSMRTQSMATIDSNTKKEAPACVQHIQVMSELIRLPAASFGARLSVKKKRDQNNICILLLACLW